MVDAVYARTHSYPQSWYKAAFLDRSDFIPQAMCARTQSLAQCKTAFPYMSGLMVEAVCARTHSYSQS